MATNIGKAILAAIAAALAFAGIYFGALSIFSKRDFTVEQFLSDRYFVIALAAGFGLQVGLFMHLRALAAVAHIPGSVSLDEKGLVRVARSYPDPATIMRRR